MSTKPDVPDAPPPATGEIVGKTDAEKIAEAEQAALVARLMDVGSRAGLAALCGLMRDVMIAHGWLGPKRLNDMIEGRLSDVPMFADVERIYGSVAAKIAWEAAMHTALGKSRLEIAGKD